jgi:uncharacterized membrane protein
MWFWWFMLLCDLIIPVVMILFGWVMERRSPKRINRLMGYRTARSMKNEETWCFANRYCGRLWWRMGWLMLLPSVAILLPFYHSAVGTIGNAGGILCGVQCVPLFLSIFLTERGLKERFPDEDL